MAGSDEVQHTQVLNKVVRTEYSGVCRMSATTPGTLAPSNTSF